MGPPFWSGPPFSKFLDPPLQLHKLHRVLLHVHVTQKLEYWEGALIDRTVDIGSFLFLKIDDLLKTNMDFTFKTTN
jgi:hypothetical protein